MSKEKQEIIKKFDSLYGDNVFCIVDNELFCNLCYAKLATFRLSNVQRHVNSEKHKRAGETRTSLDSQMQSSEQMFNEDLCKALVAAKIPLYKLQNDSLRKFLAKYSGRKVPSDSTLRKRFAPVSAQHNKTKFHSKKKKGTSFTKQNRNDTDTDGDEGDLDLSDSGAQSVDGNEASDGAGPAEANDEGSSFSRDDFETCDLSDVKVKVEHTDDFYSEPETKRQRVGDYQEESKMEEALTILRDLKQSYSASQGPNDRFTVYGQHVASKLRSYGDKTSAIVEHAINNILFEADMGNYDGIHSALPSHDDSAQ